mmetsp:Transcript_50438/g.93957  ORF Transcript_50438/g.93957 Transcript_50438/m.93957 type:complete len:292 (+) Transcript_50438:1307-2182(+)
MEGARRAQEPRGSAGGRGAVARTPPPSLRAPHRQPLANRVQRSDSERGAVHGGGRNVCARGGTRFPRVLLGNTLHQPPQRGGHARHPALGLQDLRPSAKNGSAGQVRHHRPPSGCQVVEGRGRPRGLHQPRGGGVVAPAAQPYAAVGRARLQGGRRGGRLVPAWRGVRRRRQPGGYAQPLLHPVQQGNAGVRGQVPLRGRRGADAQRLRQLGALARVGWRQRRLLPPHQRPPHRDCGRALCRHVRHLPLGARRRGLPRRGDQAVFRTVGAVRRVLARHEPVRPIQQGALGL